MYTITEELLQQPLPIKDVIIRGSFSLEDWHPKSDDTKIVVNIVAPNGGGKSVLPTTLCKLDPDNYCVLGENGHKIMTIFPNLGWGAVGVYRTKCGGADSLEKSEIFEALYKLCNSNLHVVLEGSVVANTRYTYWDAFQAIKEKFPNRVPSFIVMDYPYDTYLGRVLSRNGGKDIKEDCLKQKFVNITRYRGGYVQDGPKVGIKVHVEKTEGLKPMLLSIMKAIDEHLERPAFPMIQVNN